MEGQVGGHGALSVIFHAAVLGRPNLIIKESLHLLLHGPDG